MNKVQHLVIPGHQLAQHEILAGETVSHFLERSEWDFKLPTICLVNGQPLMRKEWASTIVLPEDDVCFLSKPHGGGGGSGSNKNMQIMGLIGVIALAAIAPWAAGGIAGMLGITSKLAIAALTGVIGLGGSLLLQTFLKPKAGGSSDDAATSQLYSIGAAGNTGKPFQPIPVQYGRLKITPDYSSSPWSEYIGDDMYLNLPLNMGVGKYLLETVLMDDTIIWDNVNGYNPAFTDVTIEQYEPGESITLFPLNVVTASEVSNLQIPSWTGTEWIGGFIVTDPDVDANALAFDFVFPGGLYASNPEGEISSRSVTIIGQIREVDNAGSPLTGWTEVVNQTVTYATREPKRYTVKIDPLFPARYEVRVRRTDADLGNSNTGANSLIWAGQRAFVVGSDSYEHTSTLAVRIKATGQTSQQSSKSFSVIQTRILPVWNGSTFVEEATTSPLYAFLDMAVNEVYGAGRTLSRIDFQKIVSEHNASLTRGDQFNYQFSSTTTFPDAFDRALAVTRAKHCWAGDILTLVRDEYKAIPQMLLTDQQIVRGSLSVTYSMTDEEAADCVIGEYLNEDTWKPAQIQYPPNDIGFTAVNPRRIRIEGITNTDQMYREIAFLYRQAYYRRINVTLDTEHDGRILKFGSVIKVQSHLPQKWGASGEVVAYNSGTRTLTLNREVTFAPSGNHYIEVRDKRGRYYGPIKCTSGVSPTTTVILDATELATIASQMGYTFVAALDRMDGAEVPSFVFGVGTELSRTCMVLRGRPKGDMVTLECVIDDPDVHDPDVGTVPTPPEGRGQFDPRTPIIMFLNANFRQGIVEPILDASWFPAPGAVYYKAEVSYEAAEPRTWTPIYEGISPKFSQVAEFAAVKVRVAGIGERHGPWTVVDVEAPTLDFGKIKLDDNSLSDAIKYQIFTLQNYNEVALQEARNAIANIAEVAAQSLRQDRKLKGEIKSTTTRLEQRNANALAYIEEVQTLVLAGDEAFAQYQLTVAAQFDDVDAAVEATNTAIAGVDYALSSFMTAANAHFDTLDASVYAQGIVLTDLDSSYSAYVISNDVAVGNLTANVTTINSALATLDGYVAASWGVTVDVNGYVVGLELVNAGSSISAFYMTVDKFILTYPGYSGAIPFAIGLVNGVSNIGMSGLVFLDGTLHARSIIADTIDTRELKQNGVTVDKIAQNAATKIRTFTGGTYTLASIPGSPTPTYGVTQSTETVIADSGSFTVAADSTINLIGHITAESNPGATITPYVPANGSFAPSIPAAWEYLLRFTVYLDGVAVWYGDEYPVFSAGYVYVTGIGNTPYSPFGQRSKYVRNIEHAMSVTAGTHQIQFKASWIFGAGLNGPNILNSGGVLLINHKSTIN